MSSETNPENPALDDLEPTEAEATEITGGATSKPKGGEAPMEETTDIQAGGIRVKL